jgi:hypothetical protein
MDKIIEGVYLGDIRAAANLFLLKAHVSTQVLIWKGDHTCVASALRFESLLPL